MRQAEVGIARLELDPAWRRTMIAGLLRGQKRDGGFGVPPYRKWTGAHWRLVSLIELGISTSSTAARAAANHVLDWIAAPSRSMSSKEWPAIIVVAGRERRHASIEGNVLRVCCRLGLARAKRTEYLAEVLLRSQWPDGGWNCDVNPTAHRSSFHETLAPIWGLIEYHRSTGKREALEAAQRAVELLLQHRVYRSTGSGEPIHPEWLHIHWPPYWHYDFFHGLRAVAMSGRLDDPRAADALERLRALGRADGTWHASGTRYWRRPGSLSQADAVEWGNAHQIVTPIARAMLQ